MTVRWERYERRDRTCRGAPGWHICDAPDHLRYIPQSRRGRNFRAWVLLQWMNPEIVDRLRNEQDDLLELVREDQDVVGDWSVLTRMTGKVQTLIMLDIASDVGFQMFRNYSKAGDRFLP